MTALTGGSKTAESKSAAPSQESAVTGSADAVSIARKAAASAAAARGNAQRGRVAERMAEIANKTASPPPLPSAQKSARSKPASGAAPKAPESVPQAPDGTAEAAPESQAQPKPQRAAKTQSAAAQKLSLLETVKAKHQDYLQMLHERVFDASREQLFFAPTKAHVPLSSLTIASPNRALGHDYRPVPCKIFDWALAQIEDDFSSFTFVDYGAGKGRAMLLAAEHPFAAVAGVEFAAELHDDAEMNIAQYPRSMMRCRNVECVLTDAV
ncbi:MAG: hypothetical protein AAF405_01385, partial [Pseudomonadota bacterium]